MKSEENCRDWKTESEHKVNENLARNAYCHICGGGLIENSFVNWHPDELKGCHIKCRESLPKPEPEPEESEKRYDATDEPSDKQIFDKTDEREFTIYGQPKWNDDDESTLEEMWKDGKSIEEIASTLDRSENSILKKIREEQIEEKTGRLRPASPEPWNSTNLPTQSCSLSISTTLRVMSVAVTPDWSEPLSSNPTTFGSSM